MVANKVIEKPLSWAQVKAAFARTAPLVKQAYDRLGAKPPAAEFTRTDTRTCAAGRCGRWTSGPTAPEPRPAVPDSFPFAQAIHSPE